MHVFSIAVHPLEEAGGPKGQQVRLASCILSNRFAVVVQLAILDASLTCRVWEISRAPANN